VVEAISMSRWKVAAGGLCSSANLIGALWVLFGAMWKFSNREEFAVILGTHRLVGPGLIPIAAVAIPAVESVVAVIALLSVAVRRPWFGSFTLCLIFLTFGGYALALHKWPPATGAKCGCGLSNETIENWANLALRNAIIGVAYAVSGVVAATRWVGSSEKLSAPLPALPSRRGT
jgi:hypothetical protein